MHMDHYRRITSTHTFPKFAIYFFLLHHGTGISTTQQASNMERKETSQSVVWETSQTNFSWWMKTHREYIISSVELKNIPSDQLPLEYWVPTKPKLQYWPNNTLPIEIHNSFSLDERWIILAALRDLSETLGQCITFRGKRYNDDDYLHFRKTKSCGSRIGYKGGRHKITLSDGCLNLDELGAVQHEVLHALGFFHEHSRNDRDEFIEVNWANVLPVGKRDLKKLRFRTYGLPYDYTSLLHYTYDAYAVNQDIPTLRPKDPAMNLTMMGQRKGLSLTDIHRVAIPYKCQDLLKGEKFRQSRYSFRKSADDDDEDNDGFNEEGTF